MTLKPAPVMSAVPSVDSLSSEHIRSAHGERRFRELVEALPAAIYTTDAEGRLTHFNRAAVELAGRVPRLGEDKWCMSWKMYRPDGTPLPHDQCPMAVALKEGRAIRGEELIVERPDGRRAWVLPSPTPLFDDAGRVVGGINMVVDITERKNADKALREGAQSLETLNYVAKILAAEAELEHLVQEVTDAATEISGAQFGAFFYNTKSETGEGYLPCALSGAPREAFARFGTPRNTRVLAHTFEGRGPVRLDDVTQDARYEKNPQSMRPGAVPMRSYLAVPVVSRTGEVIGGLFFGHPEPGIFTERAERLVAGIASQAAVAIEVARLNEQRVQLIEQLREADRRKDEFIATLSHELRNPLAPLRNALSLLRLAEDRESATAPVHEMMERQVDHLVRLVDDLLEMSRISRGTFELRKQRIELEEVVRNAIETSNPLIQAAGHQLSVSLPEESLWLDGDPVRLAQILANLLNNAANYTERSGEISVLAAHKDGGVSISVRDNGIGIAAGTRLFDMFSRGAQSNGDGGLGIGLALAKRLAEMHGGTIEACSEGPGRGSEFTVRLPLAANQRPEAALEHGIKAALAPKRILIVDDNRDGADSASLLLRFLGADVRVARSGPEALEAFGLYAPAVVLLDIGMPGMDGYEVARQIRTRFPKSLATLVALTGWGQDEDRRKAREAGFDHHLIKPADVGALRTLLTSLDGKHSES